MCTIIHNPRIKLSRKNKITVYKVFGLGKENDIPRTYCEDVELLFGKNIWNTRRANREMCDQSGFQVFAFKTHAEKYAGRLDLVVPVSVLVKNIKSACNDFIGSGGENLKVYEVKEFVLYKKDWKNSKRILKEKR